MVKVEVIIVRETVYLFSELKVTFLIHVLKVRPSGTQYTITTTVHFRCQKFIDLIKTILVFNMLCIIRLFRFFFSVDVRVLIGKFIEIFFIVEQSLWLPFYF